MPYYETSCPGCGVTLPEAAGPTHRYIEASPACWATYGDVLAREYGDPAYMASHRLTVDAYAVQHPGHPSPQSVQSVAVHLISLHVVLELGLGPAEATRLIGRATESKTYRWQTRPVSLGAVTVAEVAGAGSAAEHARVVRRWAESAWEAWSEHHDQVRAWGAAVR